ncbi:WD repeat-containing 43-like isoform X1 [Olea europaea subsp. europaea]|uniref:WD repeat-containing 43-like isoform X1 n=1 Tax=Olea europaea subsp. europaea TaxID=158383 RepID=A0A8S0QBZ3_OLEEU|nr:WD repeat-containing 43-like isoform X1 [Olea europaea subsp. europaea]
MLPLSGNYGPFTSIAAKHITPRKFSQFPSTAVAATTTTTDGVNLHGLSAIPEFTKHKYQNYRSVFLSSRICSSAKTIMRSSNISDILTSFSPSMDFFAISPGDGRIKIWDTVKGQVQTEFSDVTSNETTGIFGKKEGGHLSMDYTCMKWLSVDKKKKRKLGTSLLVLGTGGGDVLALDVSAGQLKWRVNDCHPGGVSAISFPTHGPRIYTAGADGIVCELDSMSGNLLRMFSASSSKAISSISVSPDGKWIATAAAQLKIFNASNHKKVQKFSGHPGAVRCMIFSEDGRYVLSSAVGERYVAVWKIDSSKNKSACAFLAMDHPAIFLDSMCISSSDPDDNGLCVLSVSEMGVCYFWHGKTIDELRNSKPTKISISDDDGVLKKHKGAVPNVFAAKLQTVSEPACGHVFLAYGFLIKPSFEKVLVHSGADLKLNSSDDGILLPISQSHKSKKTSKIPNQVTALDRANADGALLPKPKVLDLIDGKDEVNSVANKDKIDVDAGTLCMEDKLRSLGVLGNIDSTLSTMLDSKFLKGIDLEASMPIKKIKAAIISMEPDDAFNLLKILVDVWLSRSRSGKLILPWISCILVYHGNYVKSQDPKLLDSLYELTNSKAGAVNSLFQLSGRLQLVSAQIDKATNYKNCAPTEHSEQMEESEVEDVDEVFYDDEDSQTSSNSDN